MVKNVLVQISRDTVHVCYTRGEREGEDRAQKNRGGRGEMEKGGEERGRREERREGEGQRGEREKGREERERGRGTGE